MTLEQKEKHLNRFCKTCYDAGCMYAKLELDKETKRGNFWAKKYQDAQKETAEKVKKLKKYFNCSPLECEKIDKIFGDNSPQESGSSVSVEETKQNGMACNSEDTLINLKDIEKLIKENIKYSEADKLHICKLKGFDREEECCLPCYEKQCYKELLAKLKSQSKQIKHQKQ